MKNKKSQQRSIYFVTIRTLCHFWTSKNKSETKIVMVHFFIVFYNSKKLTSNIYKTNILISFWVGSFKKVICVILNLSFRVENKCENNMSDFQKLKLLTKCLMQYKIKLDIGRIVISLPDTYCMPNDLNNCEVLLKFLEANSLPAKQVDFEIIKIRMVYSSK